MNSDYDSFSEGPLDCGVTIHKATKEDFGAWKCLVGFKSKYNKQEKLGKVLKVYPHEDSKINAWATDVVVKVGDSYKVSII